MTSVLPILALTSPLRLEYLSIPAAALLFLIFALPVVLMGMKSLNWLGPTRKWVAISVRLSLIWVVVLLIAGAEWVRINRDLDVIVLRDVSTSTNSVTPPKGKTLSVAVDDMIQSDCRSKRANDRIGIVGFAQRAQIDALPGDHLRLDAHPIAVGGDGTDIASALRLGLASFREEAMRRLILVSDGNATQGDTDSALRAVTSMHIPVDVLPLHYEIRRDVLVDRMITPAWQRVGEPFAIDLILRSTSVQPVAGTITLTQQGLPMDLDPETDGIQPPAMRVELRAGSTAFHVKVPAQPRAGLEQFRASFQADRASDDALAGNNSADAFTFIRGKAQFLYVDGTGVPALAGMSLLNALRTQNLDIPPESHITPDQFPSRLIDLEPYDAILLANVPRGPGGLSISQDRLLARYVRDLGGGVVVIGGPSAFGAGNWRGSELEKVLPVDCEIPAERVLPAGAIVIVLDHSGSMTEPMPGSSGGMGNRTKQQVATESAILALQTLQRDDLVGVVGFAASPRWIVDLAPNDNPERSANRIREVRPSEGTSICPALEQACAVLEKVPETQAGVKRILLLTDGVSEAGNYDALLARLHAAKITLSSIAVGADADLRLLRYLAERGGGSIYAVDSPDQLRQVFVREARTLRRQLIHEPTGGIELVQDYDGPKMPKLSGMVLTALKQSPLAHAEITAMGRHHDPILASWQAGMGRAAAFTGDATSRWAARWIESPAFGAFWARVVRDVQRPPTSGDFDVRMVRDGTTTHLTVEAMHEGRGVSFLNFAGKLAGPDPDAPAADIALQQTGPGVYEASLATPQAGTYAAVIRYQGQGASGALVAGISVPQSVELRDTQSNEANLAAIADATGGRLLPPLDVGGSAGLFDREGLAASVSSHSISDLLLCILMGMLVTDVAVRRIHWDWIALKRWAFLSVAMVQGFTTTRKPNAQPTLAALRKVHEKQAAPTTTRAMIFDSGFAPRTTTEKHVPKPLAQSSLSCLKAAKVRAMEEIRERGKS